MKQNADHANKGKIGTKEGQFDKSTSAHTYNSAPGACCPEGNAAPGKHKRGKQGQ